MLNRGATVLTSHETDNTHRTPEKDKRKKKVPDTSKSLLTNLSKKELHKGLVFSIQGVAMNPKTYINTGS